LLSQSRFQFLNARAHLLKLVNNFRITFLTGTGLRDVTAITRFGPSIFLSLAERLCESPLLRQTKDG
jgi:hypothetical protein